MKYSFFLYQYLLVYYLTPSIGRLFGIFSLLQISLALLLLAFILKMKNMRIYYNSQNIYSSRLVKLIILLSGMVLISMLVSNDVGNSIYQGARFLVYIIIPFFFILMLKNINVDKIITLLIVIALLQAGLAIIEQITHINIFDYLFTYIKERRASIIRFNLYRVQSSMGPLSLAFLFLVVYPLTYYKNTILFKTARYMIPIGMIMTVSISGIALIVFEIFILNIHKLKQLLRLLKFLVMSGLMLGLAIYYGLTTKILNSFFIVSNAISAADMSVDKESGINAASRLEGFLQMIKLIKEHIYNPIGFGELYNNWDRYMPFNTDPGIPLLWGVEIGVWASICYIVIFLIAFKILSNQKNNKLSKYLLISLFTYLVMSFTTNHIETLLIPFVMFDIIVKTSSQNNYIPTNQRIFNEKL